MTEQCLLLWVVVQDTGRVQPLSSPVHIWSDVCLLVNRESAHWFLTLFISVPGISLIFPFLLNSTTYLHLFFLLSGFFVFSRKVFFISVYQIQLLEVCFFYYKVVFLRVLHFLLHTWQVGNVVWVCKVYVSVFIPIPVISYTVNLAIFINETQGEVTGLIISTVMCLLEA